MKFFANYLEIDPIYDFHLLFQFVIDHLHSMINLDYIDKISVDFVVAFKDFILLCLLSFVGNFGFLT